MDESPLFLAGIKVLHKQYESATPQAQINIRDMFRHVSSNFLGVEINLSGNNG